MKKPRNSTVEKFAAAAKHVAPAITRFRLYIAGPSDKSTRAIRHARELCDSHYKDCFELEVIDILQQPARAREDHVLAVPMLVKHIPLPVKKFIGDLSNHETILVGLGISGV
ncbi:MAG TPA: circadian clock KaiB family protein [Kofleriaceae bacterium]|jgi:circadian clock protein KaiB